MAARKPPLRAVEEGEVAPPAKPKTVTQAFKDGSTLERLESMAQRISRAVDDPKCPAAALAALTKRLDDLNDKITAIKAKEAEAETSGDVPDEAFNAEAI
jgi:hypothetical protein